MSDDQFDQWCDNQDYEELLSEFIREQGLDEAFELWIHERFVSDTADYADRLYDTMRDDEACEVENDDI